MLVGNKISPGNPVTKKDGTVVRTLWGELAWQLGGKKAFVRIRADDEKATSPGDVLRELFNEYGPSLILIDAELPGEPGNGELIRRLKQDPKTRRIPVVVLGNSDDEREIAAYYDAGVNTYIMKPVTFLSLVRLMKVFTAYWLETAELPTAPGV